MQGSFLGPLCHLLYIASISNVITSRLDFQKDISS